MRRLAAPWARIALLLVAAQLAAIAEPCPVSPIWKAVDAARSLAEAAPCPGHAHAEQVRFSMSVRCPCGCGNGLPPVMGTHYSRVGVLPATIAYDALLEVQPPAAEPLALASQREPSGIKHVPRAA